MKWKIPTIFVACAGLLVSCAPTVPKDLARARAAYQDSSVGVTAEVAPAELHKASIVLSQAEQAFKEDPESYQTKDLSYVALRKIQLADATASIAIEKKNQAQSKDDFESTQSRIIADTKQDLSRKESDLAASRRSGELSQKDLNQTRTELAASERSGKKTAAQLATEQKARADAERRAADATRRAADATKALAQLAAVKEEPRGLVITLSGSVLFASNQSRLLPQAQKRLDQVAGVLLTTRERKVVVEGHTDSKGSNRANMALSQRRADAVRDYLIQKDYESDLIHAKGMGEGTPVADNGNPEGRANNRRVEIIIERDPGMSGTLTANK